MALRTACLQRIAANCWWSSVYGAAKRSSRCPLVAGCSRAKAGLTCLTAASQPLLIW